MPVRKVDRGVFEEIKDHFWRRGVTAVKRGSALEIRAREAGRLPVTFTRRPIDYSPGVVEGKAIKAAVRTIEDRFPGHTFRVVGVGGKRARAYRIQVRRDQAPRKQVRRNRL